MSVAELRAALLPGRYGDSDYAQRVRRRRSIADPETDEIAAAWEDQRRVLCFGAAVQVLAPSQIRFAGDVLFALLGFGFVSATMLTSGPEKLGAWAVAQTIVGGTQIVLGAVACAYDLATLDSWSALMQLFREAEEAVEREVAALTAEPS